MAEKIYEVRCCCQPKKLLGFISTTLPNRAGAVSFVLGGEMEFVRANWSETPQPLSSEATVRFITLNLAYYHPSPSEEPYLAFKAEGVTIHDLKTIPGFKER